MGKRPTYPPEFRRRILDLVRSGRSVSAVAGEFEVSRQTIMNWQKQDDLDSGRRADGLTTEERIEMTKLRKRVRELEMEREHLKKSRSLVRSGNECRSEQIFGLVKPYQAQYPVRNLCQILGVSSSGFYAWLKRPPSRRRLSDIMIGDRLEAFHRESDGNYGRPRLHADLREYGIAISGKCVARSMRERNIQGATRRRFTVTTVRDRTARPAPDLVDRRFQADAPDQLWVADITYVPTWSGFLYLAVVLDVYSRRIVGWAMANHLRTELVLDALDMAIFRRNPKSVIHHSDQGTQYTSISFGSRCREAGIRPSMGSVGDCYDNAMCESWNATLECELLVKRRFKNQREASIAIFDFIEGWYNPRRRHSALGYLSPNNFERRMSQAA